jgi:3-hydroxyisobutyrate dehydrogenase
MCGIGIPGAMIGRAVVLGDGQVGGEAHVVGHGTVPEAIAPPSRCCVIGPVTETVGVIGVGRMGLPVCARLAAAGVRVVAMDLRPEREQAVLAAGAGWEGDTERLAREAAVLITVLPGSSDLSEAMAIALEALRPDATWIDLTSAALATGLELVQRAHARGIECLDAPVGGGVEAATAGTLQLFVGGRDEVVERHRRILELLGRVEYVGDHGAGYTTKLLVNLLWFGQAVAVGEALLLARRAGVDLDALRSALGRSAAASEFVRRDLSALLAGDYLDSFGIDRCWEELAAVVELADELAVPFELSAAVERAYRAAFARYGPIDGELLAIALLEERAGIRLRGRSAG